MVQIEIPHDPHHLGDPSAGSKMIFKPMARSVETMYLSCVKISTMSKRTESSFHLTLLTLAYRRVRLKWFLSLGMIWRKPSTYLALTLTLSPNRLKWDSTWPTSPRSSIRCVQKDFRAWSTFGTNMHLCCVKINAISKQTKMSIHLSL
jgi:hypothetical protein